MGEVARHSGLYKFHSCALCREVSRRKLFAKIPSLPLVFEIRRAARGGQWGQLPPKFRKLP